MIRIKQEATYSDEDWWDWSVELDAPKQMLDRVKFVEYELHPTFPRPIRRITDRDSSFRLSTGGWGTFPIRARVVFEDGREEQVEHELELHYPDGTMTTR